MASNSQTNTQSASATSANTLIVFDWDNTLFPTKAMQLISSRPGKAKFTKKDGAELCKLSQWVYRVLRAYIAVYSSQNIRIVTAARQGWVESSLKSVRRFGRWTQIAELISSSSIEILPLNLITYAEDAILPFKSATEVLNYKHRAFVSSVAGCASRLSRPSMLLSVGDSDAEFAASKQCADKIEGMKVGRVKLQSHPSLSCMSRQCQFLVNVSAKLCVANFDIDVSRK